MWCLGRDEPSHWLWRESLLNPPVYLLVLPTYVPWFFISVKAIVGFQQTKRTLLKAFSKYYDENRSICVDFKIVAHYSRSGSTFQRSWRPSSWTTSAAAPGGWSSSPGRCPDRWYSPLIGQCREYWSMIGRQGGEGHVNGQTAEAMVEKMSQRGWRKDRDANNISRMFNQYSPS